VRTINVRNLSKAAGLPAALIAAAGVAVVVLAAAPQASATTSAPSGRDTQPRTETIELVAKQAQSQTIDVGEKGLSLGDQLIITEDLHKDGQKIGDQTVICTYAHLDPNALQCLGTFALPDGQITSQALQKIPPKGTPAPATGLHVAITGGTRAYSTAQGSYDLTIVSPTEERITLHITH
jgi:hypothetical protein